MPGVLQDQAGPERLWSGSPSSELLPWQSHCLPPSLCLPGLSLPAPKTAAGGMAPAVRGNSPRPARRWALLASGHLGRGT